MRPSESAEERGVVPVPLSGSGFTLVEMLLVIAIIAVIAALAMPAVSNAHTAANRVKSLSNIRQLGAAHLAYAGDHDGGLPPLSESMVPGTSQTKGPWWPDLILPYLGYPSNYADKHRTQQKQFPDVYYNPLVKNHFPWTDFGVNRFIYYYGGVSFKLARIPNLHTIMLMDAGKPGSSYEGDWMLGGDVISNPSGANLAPRKDNKLSVVYFDGSAEVITRQYFIENSLKMAGPNYGLGQ